MIKDVLYEIVEILKTLTPLIVAVGFAWLKRDASKNKDEINLKIETRQKITFEALTTLEGRVTQIQQSLTNHFGDDIFRKEYKTKIKSIVNDVIKNPFISQKYKNMISHYSEMVEKFGLNWFYSPIRKESERQRRKFLNQEMLVLIKDFSDYVNSCLDCIKPFKGAKVQFAEFLEMNQLYNSLYIMIDDLARNGFTDDNQVILKFEDHIDKFCDNFITAYRIWDDIKNPYVEEDKM